MIFLSLYDKFRRQYFMCNLQSTYHIPRTEMIYLKKNLCYGLLKGREQTPYEMNKT